MKAIIGLGKYFFAVPLFIFGIFHFMSADAMAGMAFGQVWLVYLTGLALIAAGASIIMGKMDKLAALLLALMLILFVVLVHLKGAMDGDQGSTAALLKDIMLAGGALMYASMAKDNSVVN
jgi:putative oxidoreductase